MDDVLVQGARAGDEDAWRELYRLHAGRLQLWLQQNPTGDVAAEAADVAIEAWTIAAQKIADFRGDDDAFAGWLFGIARNLAVNMRRRHLRRRTTSTDTIPERPTEQGSFDEVEHAASVRALVSTLPGREAEVITSIEVVGLDVCSTARALGISQAAVRMAHRRGLARLRQTFSHGLEPLTA